MLYWDLLTSWKYQPSLSLFLKSEKIPALLHLGKGPEYKPFSDFRPVPSAYWPRARACTNSGPSPILKHQTARRDPNPQFGIGWNAWDTFFSLAGLLDTNYCFMSHARLRWGFLQDYWIWLTYTKSFVASLVWFFVVCFVLLHCIHT
jgi:hypothetical protein